MIKHKTKIISAILLIIFSLSLASAATRYWQADSNNFSLSNRLFVNPSNGNIGIGNSTPVSRLHVSGNSYFAGDVNITGTLYGGSPVKIGGGIQIIGTAIPPVTCNSANKGVMFFNSSNDRQYICDGTTWNVYKGTTGDQGSMGPPGYNCSVSGDTTSCRDGSSANTKGATGSMGPTGYYCYISGNYVYCQNDGMSSDLKGAKGATVPTSWTDGSGKVTTTKPALGVGTQIPRAAIEVRGPSNSGAVSIGDKATNFAGWEASVVMGYDSDTGTGGDSNDCELSIGFTNRATGYGSQAMGNSNTASGTYSTAMGNSNTASGEGSVAMGQLTSAGGLGSVTMGYSTTASNSNAVAMGYSTTASGVDSIAIGRGITVSGQGSIGIGLNDASTTLSQSRTLAIVGGNLGIGALNPTSTLEVNGTVELFSDYASETCNNDHTAVTDLIVTGYIYAHDWGAASGYASGCTGGVSMGSFTTCNSTSYKRVMTSVDMVGGPYIPVEAVSFPVKNGQHWGFYTSTTSGTIDCVVAYARLGQ